MVGKANLQALKMLEFVICNKVNAGLDNIIVIFLKFFAIAQFWKVLHLVCIFKIWAEVSLAC